MFSVPKRDLSQICKICEKVRLRQLWRNRGDREDRINQVKQAILATVVQVKRKCSDSVVVLLESDELSDAAEVVSTGLDCEQSHKSSKSGLEVTCKGDPRAKTGDKVPVIVNS